jgi:hypothetical protein
MADHAGLTGASLHESKGVASAAVGTVYVANGAGSGSWTTLGHTSLAAGAAVAFGYTQTITEFSTTSLIPLDDTIPQITEGVEVLTLSHTPKLSTNILKIDVALQVESGTNSHVNAALFVDATASALAAASSFSGAGSSVGWQTQRVVFTYVLVAGSISARTYRVRIGGDFAGTCYLNRKASGGLFGNVESSNICLTEFKA